MSSISNTTPIGFSKGIEHPIEPEFPVAGQRSDANHPDRLLGMFLNSLFSRTERTDRTRNLSPIPFSRFRQPNLSSRALEQGHFQWLSRALMAREIAEGGTPNAEAVPLKLKVSHKLKNTRID